MESQATRRFSWEIAARSGTGGSTARELDTAEVIVTLEYRGAGSSVQPGNSERVGLPGAVHKPCELHHLQQLIGWRETANGGWQVIVGAILAADQSSNGRQHAAEV